MDYKSAYAQLGAAYNPQTAQINTEIGQLQPQQDAQMAALDQAKVNAFRDITNSSNARGVLFSGVPIDEQAQYVGTKYLPAVAGLKSTFQNSRNSLTQQLNALNAERVKTAQSNVSAYAKAQADAQYKQAELALRAQANAISASRVGSSGGLSAAQQLAQNQKAGTVTAAQQLVAEWKRANMFGRDGYISPDTYKKGQQLWATNGFDPNQYNSLFAGYRNPGNPYYGVK